MTPMQSQYNKLKNEYNDAILLFRLGDFYEAFYEDAETLSKVLGITLTGRGKGEARYAMAGIPHHSLHNYLPKLVENGLKIAIADQMEDATPGKLVERSVTQVITAGTITDEKSLDSSKNNFIASIFVTCNKNNEFEHFYLSYADISTGELNLFETKNIAELKNEIIKISPAEILVQDFLKSELEKAIDVRFELVQNAHNHQQNLDLIKDQLNVKSLKGFGINEESDSITSIAELLNYIKNYQKKSLKHIQKINRYNYSNYMQLDESTIKNLELLFPLNSFSKDSATVFSVLNHCQTSMGTRFLRRIMLNPLINKEQLTERLDSVEFFLDNPIATDEIRELLSSILDLERIVGRIGMGSCNPKDLIALKYGLTNILKIKQQLKEQKITKRIKKLLNILSDKAISEIIHLIEESLDDDAPAVISDGNIIKEGFNAKIDEIRDFKNNSKNILTQIQARESARTNIPSLKISFNKIFGYYIEITKTNLQKVPNDYIRKQTLANAERFITEELKQVEEKILTSEEKLMELEKIMFYEIVNKVSKYLNEILDFANAVAELDLLSNFGFIARKFTFTKPIITDENKIEILNGRHIVVESINNKFVPNSTEFNKKSSIHILTGPNMSGKSTYIRQVALIVYLAQVGCFVPAEKLEFNLTDRIFTRVGASDNLAKGESTFMVEMSEVANILNNATKNSLIILDEVGRGTSTYDGVAIAWSIIEYIDSKLKAKTLFATHYHELTTLEKSQNSVKNFHVEVIEKNNQIEFMYKIKEGGTDKSYGVHVAKIAGVPAEVTENANKILKNFESDQSIKNKSNNKPKNQLKTPKKIHPEQLTLVD